MSPDLKSTLSEINWSGILELALRWSEGIFEFLLSVAGMPQQRDHQEICDQDLRPAAGRNRVVARTFQVSPKTMMNSHKLGI